MEALHARGFTSVESIQALSQSQFATALSGTVAFIRAQDIYNLAIALPSDLDGHSREPPVGFQPINSGNLTNCEPPCHLSPFGPVQYLSDLLHFASGSNTLGQVLASRRGQFGSLLVTDANLNTQLPVLDLVNENLESLASNLAVGQGSIYNTEVDGLTGLDIAGAPTLSIPPELAEQDILKALPEHSTPHLPLDQPTIYDTLKSSVVGPALPYSQPLDVSRTYLKALGTSRFEVMRTFLKDVTEFALNASQEPTEFQKDLWRLPVRYEIALEYLGISQEEATIVFGGNMTTSTALELLGVSAAREGGDLRGILTVPVFIKALGISYCDFLELYQSGFVAFGPGEGCQGYPECLPCCADDLVISFPERSQAAAGLIQLAVFIRLWQKLRHTCMPYVSMKTLGDICHTLPLFTNQNVNPDFLRQLASLLMIKEIWDPPWTNTHSTNILLLSIWSGVSSGTDEFRWAVNALLKSIERHALSHYKCAKTANWHKLSAADLDQLATLFGFIEFKWYSKPTCTIRFMEILTKIYVSKFTVGEIVFLFTANTHLLNDDPFPFTEEDESKEDPLNVPEDADSDSLWALRRKLLDVEVCDEEELECWSWQRIECTMTEMGYKPHGEEFSLSYFAEHFFPEILEESGQYVSAENRRFSTTMNKSSSPHIWHPLNACSPFSYSAVPDSEAAATLWTTLPLCDEKVIDALVDTRQLTSTEASAVRTLCLMPQTAMAPFALLFTNFNHAVSYMVQEPCVHRRFRYFQRQFAKFYKKCRIIAHHVHDAVVSAEHIDSAECTCASGDEWRCDGLKAAWHILISLIADENRPQSPWEDATDAGNPPTDFVWDPNFSGGAFAALIGLTGTGLEGDYKATASYTVWKEIRGGLAGWGKDRDCWNAPVPTVLPRLTLTPSTEQSSIVSFKNGFALKQSSGRYLSGAEPFTVVWKGVLLVEKSGCYHFAFGCPTHPGEDQFCNLGCEKFKIWNFELSRGHKSWNILQRGPEGSSDSIPDIYSKQVPLRRGAYDITVQFLQLEPNFDDENDLRKVHTGFKMSYTGPDTDHCLREIPISALYLKSKDGVLFNGGEEVSATVTQVLNLRYIPTLRDIRRTYQRAFKAVLFANRFCISACLSHCEGESELGFLLDHPDRFQGSSYYWDTATSTFKTHHAYLNFNFLPVTDAYCPPSADEDMRVQPSEKRQNAMFDWFERIFDYTVLRRQVAEICKPQVWLLFFHAASDSPQPVAQLLTRLGVEVQLARLVLEYFSTPDLFQISDSNNNDALTDERWVTRIWKARSWLCRLQNSFYSPITELSYCRPALWASIPQPDVSISGTTGNINLTLFVQRACLGKINAKVRLDEVVHLNNGLRVRARDAILAYLAALGQSSDVISDHLLIDVHTAVRETTTRIDEAISAAQRLMQRAIIGLEPQFPVDDKTVQRWECKLASFDKWQASQRRKWYYEDWLQWDEVRRLENSEGFRSLNKALKSGSTTVATVARNYNWTGTAGLPAEPAKEPISSAEAFVLGTQQQALDEGLQLMGTPDHSGTPTWLAPLRVITGSGPPSRDQESRSLREFPEGESGGPQPNGKASMGAKSTTILTPQSSESQLPGADAIDFIPLWVQAALRLGVRFIRVAASSLPIAAPYSGAREDRMDCCQCSTQHPPVIDEYYFWLQEAQRFDPGDAPAPQNADLHKNVPGVSQTTDPNNPQIDPRTIQADPTSDWDSPTPQMLFWKSEPIVYLYWTRVHRGVLQDPRRSTMGIPLVDNDLSNLYLDLRGRQFDSLLFNVKQGDSSTGFRYDIATDTAIVIPEAVASPNPPALPLPTQLTDNLAAFPYFLYFDGGAPLVPIHNFGTSMLIASSLRTDCRYQESLNWLRIVYDPLCRANTWMQCPNSEPNLQTHSEQISSPKLASTDLFSDSSLLGNAVNAPEEFGAETTSEGHRFPQDGTCCPTAPVKGGVSRARAVTLAYLDTLFAWAESLRCRNSLEADQQALTLLTVADKILGPKPKDVLASDETGGNMTVGTFQASSPSLNPKLVWLYGTVNDRVALLRSGINRRRLRNGINGRDVAIWGSHRRFDLGTTLQYKHGVSDCYDSCVYSCSQTYRFNIVLGKANQWISMVKSTGSALASAFEKADAEALSDIKAAQERQVTELGLDISKNQYRAADWDVQALDVQMNNAVARLQYYQKLISDGLNPNETGYIFATGASMASRTSATVVDGVAQGMAAVPDMWIGVAGAYGSPLQFQQMPMGVKMGTGFATAARILNTVADISSSTAGLNSTNGGWDRRSQDWQHQCDVTVYDIQQIKRQRLAARRRLEISLRELNNTQRRIEHQAEIQDFMRDKFTKYELYLWLQQENAALYRQIFNNAVDVATEAQQAARYELGDTSLDLIPSAASSWNSLHAGFLAGEKLDLAVNSLERSYLNKNCREYELMKNVSLRLHFPASFVLLKSTGYCEVDIPEWFFDIDYPGHYMRRIRSVSLTIPCVAGPYSGIHCKLQLLSSSIRVRPWSQSCNECCCSEERKKDKAQTQPAGDNDKSNKQQKQPGKACIHDPSVITRYAGTEAIATSTGQNDSGLFEVSFSDPRYLPFEYSGAVSRWRIELPPENNQFDFDSLSDLIMHIKFTAREGGPEFKRTCHETAQARLPADGLRFFDVRHEMPEAWAVLRKNERCNDCQTIKDCEDDAGCIRDDCSPGCERPRRHGHEDHHEEHHEDHHERHRREGEGDRECRHCDDKNDHDRSRRDHGNRCRVYRDEERCHECRKGDNHGSRCECKRRHHYRDFHLELSRQMFPFLNRCGHIAVTKLHILLDINECGGHTLKVFHMRFRPPGECEDKKEKIQFIRTAGGIWVGSIEFKPAVMVPERDIGFPTRCAKGMLGTFEVPCDVKGVCKAWLLCKYDVQRQAPDDCVPMHDRLGSC